MNEEEKGKKSPVWSVAYFATLFLLSAVIGYNIKLIALKRITTGFEDSKIKGVKSDYDFSKAEEALKKLQEERNASAQAGEQTGGTGANNTEGGSCGQ